jgi:hypothetical protein
MMAPPESNDRQAANTTMVRFRDERKSRRQSAQHSILMPTKSGRLRQDQHPGQCSTQHMVLWNTYCARFGSMPAIGAGLAAPDWLADDPNPTMQPSCTHAIKEN